MNRFAPELVGAVTLMILGGCCFTPSTDASASPVTPVAPAPAVAPVPAPAPAPEPPAPPAPPAPTVQDGPLVHPEDEPLQRLATRGAMLVRASMSPANLARIAPFVRGGPRQTKIYLRFVGRGGHSSVQVNALLLPSGKLRYTGISAGRPRDPRVFWEPLEDEAGAADLVAAAARARTAILDAECALPALAAEEAPDWMYEHAARDLAASCPDATRNLRGGARTSRRLGVDVRYCADAGFPCVLVSGDVDVVSGAVIRAEVTGP